MDYVQHRRIAQVYACYRILIGEKAKLSDYGLSQYDIDKITEILVKISPAIISCEDVNDKIKVIFT